jgi:hypothetical protein
MARHSVGLSPSVSLICTDGRSVIGQALVRALIRAGSRTVWLGHLTSTESVRQAAAQMRLAQHFAPAPQVDRKVRPRG